MKYKFLKATLLGFLFSIYGVASAGIIVSSNWQISSIVGAYAESRTDWSGTTPLTETEINTFLSDSVLDCESDQSAYCGVNALKESTYTGYAGDAHSITVDFNSLYTFTDVDLYTSRAINIDVVISFFNDNTLLSATSFVPFDQDIIGWQGVQTKVRANRIVFDFDSISPNSRQFIMHELRFSGAGATSVPEPSTLAIFALGIIGLASRRFKKQS